MRHDMHQGEMRWQSFLLDKSNRFYRQLEN
jgi:hypothetical protein